MMPFIEMGNVGERTCCFTNFEFELSCEYPGYEE